MAFNDLTDDLKEKARSCSSPEELAEFVESEGIDLTNAQLGVVAGGIDWTHCTDFSSDPV